jgi:hypothetical protein
MLQYKTEFEEVEGLDKKGVIFPVRAPSIESVMHLVRHLYMPVAHPDSFGHFNPISDIS